MMATTHSAVGLLLATPVALLVPELALPAALAGLAGGLFPDLDLLVGTHRKTLHYPAYYWLVALPAVAVAVAAPAAPTVGIALFLLSAAVHSVSDVFGAGLEARPWEGTSQKGVYLHAQSRWVAPRRLIRYDGAPEDLAAAAVVAVPGLVLFDDRIRLIVVVGLAVSAVYVAVRKRLPAWILEWLQ
jgi:hypothetical protein